LMKYTENALFTKLVSFTRLYRDALSTEHKNTKQKIQQLKVEV